MPVLSRSVARPWSWVSQHVYSTYRAAPTTYQGWVVEKDVRITHPEGIPPFVLHKPYTRVRTAAPVISRQAFRQVFDRHGKWRYTQFLEGTSDVFLTWDGGPTKPDMSYDVPTRLKILAELDMYAELAEAKVGLGQMLAELRKTSEGVARSANTVLNAALAAKRRNWRGLLSVLGIKRHRWRASARNVGGRWLEVSFGWMPLIQDIDTLIGFADSLYAEPMRFTVRGRKYQQVEEEYFRASPKLNFKRRVMRKGRMGYSAQMLVEVDTSWHRQLTNFGGQPVPVIWETLPFSFLIDYLVPVGHWLAAQSAMAGLRFVSGSYSMLYAASHKEAVVGSALYGDVLYSTNEAVTFDLVRMQRIVYDRPPTPMLAMKYPLTSWKRAGNIVALLLQTLRDFPKSKGN